MELLKEVIERIQIDHKLFKSNLSSDNRFHPRMKAQFNTSYPQKIRKGIQLQKDHLIYPIITLVQWWVKREFQPDIFKITTWDQSTEIYLWTRRLTNWQHSTTQPLKIFKTWLWNKLLTNHYHPHLHIIIKHSILIRRIPTLIKRL